MICSAVQILGTPLIISAALILLGRSKKAKKIHEVIISLSIGVLLYLVFVMGIQHILVHHDHEVGGEHDETHVHGYGHNIQQAHSHEHKHSAHSHEHKHDDSHSHEHKHDDSHSHEHKHDDSHSHEHKHADSHSHEHKHGDFHSHEHKHDDSHSHEHKHGGHLHEHNSHGAQHSHSFEDFHGGVLLLFGIIAGVVLANSDASIVAAVACSVFLLVGSFLKVRGMGSRDSIPVGVGNGVAMAGLILAAPLRAKGGPLPPFALHATMGGLAIALLLGGRAIPQLALASIYQSAAPFVNGLFTHMALSVMMPQLDDATAGRPIQGVAVLLGCALARASSIGA